MPFQLEWFKNWAIGLGEDPAREGLRGTPARMSAALEEMLCGYKANPAEHLETLFLDPGATTPIHTVFPFFSLCEHHVLPFWGEASIKYAPTAGRIVGLSKIPRFVKCLSARLQTQERLTREIADVFFDNVKPRWIDVQLEAQHLCVSARGVALPMTTFTTARRQAV